jgi:hypothetical protein
MALIHVPEHRPHLPGLDEPLPCWTQAILPPYWLMLPLRMARIIDIKTSYTFRFAHVRHTASPPGMSRQFDSPQVGHTSPAVCGCGASSDVSEKVVCRRVRSEVSTFFRFARAVRSTHPESPTDRLCPAPPWSL